MHIASQFVGRIGSRRKGTAHLQQPRREGVLMSRLEIYKKQAKQLVRWHREGNYSIGGRIRGLARYRKVTDRQALALAFPLREAQEIIALEAGYASWAALKVAVANEPSQAKPRSPALRLTRAVPVIFVANVTASA